MMSNCQNIANKSCPISCEHIYKDALQNAKIISTGCFCLDDLLDGGLWTGELVEVCGLPGTGKSQFCKTVCADLISAGKNTVLFIDGSGSFISERFFEIVASRKGLCNPQFLRNALPRMKNLRVFNAESLLVELRKIDQKLTIKVDAFSCELKLLILDSISPLISPILGGAKTQGHMLLTEIGRTIKRIAIEHNVATVIVNSMVADCDAGPIWSYKPALGKSWVSVPHTRIFFEAVSKDQNKYQATLTKSSRKILGLSAKFSITAKGIEDDVS